MKKGERSESFVSVGYFLSAFGEKNRDSRIEPPRELGTRSWKYAYATFFSSLGGGRTLGGFANSLQATRDAFDSWVDSGRRGWRRSDGSPKPLQTPERRALALLSGLERSVVWAKISPFADLGVSKIPGFILADIEAEEASDGELKMEGNQRVVVSARTERDPSLRADAIRIHGLDCAICGFNFGLAYGELGEGFAEVHHVVPFGTSPEPRLTNPASDLAVVCSNCHRMLHRRRDRVLDIGSLRRVVLAQRMARRTSGDIPEAF